VINLCAALEARFWPGQLQSLWLGKVFSCANPGSHSIGGNGR